MTDSLTPIIRAVVAATLLAATATLVLVTVSTARATDLSPPPAGISISH